MNRIFARTIALTAAFPLVRTGLLAATMVATIYSVVPALAAPSHTQTKLHKISSSRLGAVHGGEPNRFGKVAALARRLRTAGYSVYVQNGPCCGLTRRPQDETAHVQVHIPGTKSTPTSTGGTVYVYFFSSTLYAAKAAKGLAPIDRAHPKQGRSLRIGVRLYSGGVEFPAVLPVAAFNRIVAVAEGRSR